MYHTKLHLLGLYSGQVQSTLNIKSTNQKNETDQ